MRKLIPAALAALMALSLAAVAGGQGPSGATLDISVTPGKAGTKSKPKSSKIKLKITNDNSKRTLSELVISLGKNVKLSTKGLTKCDADTLANGGPDACPSGSQVGSGVANALAGVNTGPGTPLNFEVFTFITGSKSLGFYIRQKAPGELNFLVPATIGSASGVYGSKLTLKIPSEPAQQYPTGNWNGLVSLENTISKKKGSNSLVTTVGCKSKKHPFKAVLTFVANPDPANAGTVQDTDESTCS